MNDQPQSPAPLRIGIVAPGRPLTEELAMRVTDVARRQFGAAQPDLLFHPQCFLSHGHCAGTDQQRLDALIEIANDPGIDAIWFARGGYGACRIAIDALDHLGPHARRKQWLGYSDAGFLLAGLYARGFRHVAHGPMPGDIQRTGGDAAIRRALGWLTGDDAAAIEPTMRPGTAYLAFNLAVLSDLLGTPLEPDFTGHVLMIEDVGEYHYAIDRALFHVLNSPTVQRCAGIAIGRFSDIPENDVPFGEEPAQMVAGWCERVGVPFHGLVDIGHDAGNRIVPFGLRT